MFRHATINNTSTYKYLGTTLDKYLNLNEQFDKTYKKTTTQLKLLSKVQKHLTKDAMDAAIRAYILPTVMFSCLTNLKLNNIQIRRLDSISNCIEMSTTKTSIFNIIST